MILKEHLHQIIEKQTTRVLSKKIIIRNIEFNDDTNRIIVISGIRRCGKSTLLRQRFCKSDNALFINFEDPRLVNFELNDFQKIEDIASETGKKILIFDEVQNIAEWEKYARAAFDSGIKLYVTGSNAGMLSRELGTRLTGRYKQIELYPFDYLEYLKFTNQKQGEVSCRNYLLEGGFPEYLKENDKEYLQTLLKDIITRDIAVRNNIRNEQLIVRLAVNLMSNIGKEFSFNKLSNSVGIKSVRTTIDYCDYLQQSYLLEYIPRFSYSIHKQQNNPKKIYSCDTGLAKANSLSFTDDSGRLLENAVFLELRRHYNDIQYFKDENSECDFLVKIGNKVVYAVQVCWKLTNDNLKREINGLKNAIEQTKAKDGVIITLNQEDVFDEIKAVPFWKWQIK